MPPLVPRPRAGADLSEIWGFIAEDTWSVPMHSRIDWTPNWVGEAKAFNELNLLENHP
jgi:hypothetical protein